MAKPKETSGQKVEVQNTHYTKLLEQCNRLDQLGVPYVFGGGHDGYHYNPTSLDCSAAVCLVLHLAGYSLSLMNSSGLESWGEPGRGKVTIWANADHVFLEFVNKQWGWQNPSTGGGWLPLDWNNTSEFTPRHPPGLSGPAGQVEESGSGELVNGGNAGNYLSVETTSKAAAISSFLNLPGLLGGQESEALKGQRSLMNDQPLLPWIDQLSKASLRNFMSMPNGNFFAFIPDYFGGLTQRQAYWEIDDIEILSGEIHLSDDALATHVYIVGDANADQEVNMIDKMGGVGVVTIFNAFMANFITGTNSPKVGAHKNESEREATAAQAAYDRQIENLPTLADKDKAIGFLEKYGARPYYEEAPMIRSHYFEMFMAYQMFCLLWSKQFEAKFELTFMPELFPGGLVKFPSYGIQCYIEEVSHTGSYESGFTTIVVLTAPSALPESGRKGISAGMVRSAALKASNVNVTQPSAKQRNQGKA